MKMKKDVFIPFTLFMVFSSIVNVQTKGGDGHKPKRWIRHIFHKPIKHHLNLKHKKHDVLTLAAPPTVGSLLPSTSTMTLMPNGVPAAAGEYIHHLMHRHPLNIPVYHGGYHPVHVPEHFGPLGPFGHHWFYRHSPWQGYGYGVRYPFAHGFASGPWYGALPAHGFGYGYHHHFGHAPFRGGLLRHVLANYNYDLGHGYRRGFGYGHGYDHGDGNWRFNPTRGWYPYSFDHSVDLRGDSDPKTVFVERDTVPSGSRGSKNDGKINLHRIIKTGRKTTRTKRVHVHHPAHRLRHLLGSRIIPIGFRIQRYKIRLIPMKRKLKHSNAFKKLKKSLKKSKGKH